MIGPWREMSQCREKSQSESRRQRPSFDADEKISSLPSVHVRPIERQIHTVAGAHIHRVKIRDMNAQRRVASRSVVYRAPVIHAPMDDGRGERRLAGVVRTLLLKRLLIWGEVAFFTRYR